MPNVVQFLRMSDFIQDLADGDTQAIYYELIEQRISHSDYGMSRWQKTTVVRAIVATGRGLHSATLTVAHGPLLDRIQGRLFDPTLNEGDLWEIARQRHERLIEHTMFEVAKHGLINIMRPGILHIADDAPLVFAEDPIDRDVAPQQEVVEIAFQSSK